MPRRGPLARQRALRALAEGARATTELLADATGRSQRALKLEAEREGWRFDRAPVSDIALRVRTIAAGLLEKVEAIGRAALEEGGKIDKAELEGVVVMIRGLDKIGEIMRPEEAAKEDQNRRDEDLADVLQRINERIVELAREFAHEICARDSGAGRRGSGQG
jgi:hypothetical protein